MTLIEKRLEIVNNETINFRQKNWSELLRPCGVKILSSFSNPQIDAYLLSESSLFVFAHHFILITCGGGNPLRLLEQAPFPGKGIQYHYEERGLEGVKNFTLESKTSWLEIFSVEDAQCNEIFSGDLAEQIRNIETFLNLKNKWPGFQFQNHLFEPRGYSVNGIQGENYLSIHWSFEEGHNLLSIESSESFRTSPRPFPTLGEGNFS
ncbi:MAG: hypothetical protein HQM15_05230 [Deltaproteobacteria bacterium]|nr:hypothetical protein [Deltaproteobacteria bacterium]